MTEYTKFGVTLSQYQIRKIKSAYKKDISVIIRISKKNLSGKTLLALTETQINKIKKSKTGVQLCLSKEQLNHMKTDYLTVSEKTGGFLPLLLAAIPAIAAAVGGVGGLTAGISSAVNSTRLTNDQIRHNKTTEDIAKQQLGSGIISDTVASIPLVGKKLSRCIEENRTW